MDNHFLKFCLHFFDRVEAVKHVGSYKNGEKRKRDNRCLTDDMFGKAGIEPHCGEGKITISALLDYLSENLQIKSLESVKNKVYRTNNL